jgi:predicted secreted protein
MVRTSLVLCIVALLPCGACHHDGGPAPVPTGAASTASTGAAGTFDAGDVVIGVEDDGRTVDVARGATVTFRLPLASGTGYGWVPAPSDGGVLVQQGERTGERPAGEEGGMPGGPRLDVYRFAARSDGTVIMEMQLKRPWETDTPPARTLRVTIRVH